jgi:spermidine synthase
MVIGPGGGNEIFVAHSMGAARIVGVELNPAMLDATYRTYADFSGHLYGTSNARAVVSEGRAFARSLGSEEKFDIIQMSGVDTWAGLSSGAYVLSENFLYTTQAFQDFYAHLKDDGILSIGRFRLDPPRESLRLVSVALQALRELGVARPEEHVAALSFGTSFMGRLLVKRSPFSPSEVKLLQREVERAGGGGELYYAPGAVHDNPYSRLAVSFAARKEQAFFEEYPYDVTPVTDDRPFFFEYYKWSRLFRDLAHPGTGGQVGANRPVGLIILGGLLAQVGLLVLVFVLAPLWLFRKDGMKVPRWGSAVLYFSCLGLGFMFVEIGLMQRFVLFLAHPAYAIPVVLATLLVSSGAGSLVAASLPFESEQRLRLCLTTVAVLLVVLLAILGPLFDACLGLPFAARVIVAVSILIPLGIVLGMPFPLGIGRVGANHPHLVPWAWGINGGMSVLGSILAIMIAMGTGFSWVLLGAAGLYLLALVAARRIAA